MSENFLCYECFTKCGMQCFIYWQIDASILGVTDFATNVFEVKLDRRERKKLLRNVAESLVETKWKNVFVSKAFKLGEIRCDSMQLHYIVESVEIPRVEDPNLCKNKNILLFKNSLVEIGRLSNLLNATGSPREMCVSQSQASLITTHAATVSTPQKVVKTNAGGRRRKIGEATGVTFSDNED